MAKTRAQRKAERRKREAEAARDAGTQARAQRDTQVPTSGEVAEAEAILETGAQPEELGESVRPEKEPRETPRRETVQEEPPPKAPAPSRADVGVPRESRRERKRRERAERDAKAERRRAREEPRKPAEAVERRRGPVISFFISCWAELKRVQWPDRQTLIQASAVTVLFVAVAAAYLGALDAIFNWLVKAIL